MDKIIISPVSDGEYELVKPLFTERAEQLGKSQKKGFHIAGYDKSKYFKIMLKGETFIVAAGRVIKEILTDVLPIASKSFPLQFGTKHANKVLDALHSIDNWGDRNDYDAFLSSEQFCFAFYVKPDGTVDEKVLRLDLFRLIQKVEEKQEWVFTGGLMHVLAHFSANGSKLSTGNGEIDLDNAIDILGPLIEGFFLRPHINTPGKKYFETRSPIGDSRDLLCAFFKEPNVEAYFIATAHIREVIT